MVFLNGAAIRGWWQRSGKMLQVFVGRKGKTLQTFGVVGGDVRVSSVVVDYRSTAACRFAPCFVLLAPTNAWSTGFCLKNKNFLWRPLWWCRNLQKQTRVVATLRELWRAHTCRRRDLAMTPKSQQQQQQQRANRYANSEAQPSPKEGPLDIPSLTTPFFRQERQEHVCTTSIPGKKVDPRHLREVGSLRFSLRFL